MAKIIQIAMPDGSVRKIEISGDTPTSAEMDAIYEQTYNPVVEKSSETLANEAILGKTPLPLSMLNQFKEGILLGGPSVDDAIGMVSDPAGRAMSENLKAFEQEHPYGSMGLKGAGTIASILALRKLKPVGKALSYVDKLAGKGLSTVEKIGRGAPVGFGLWGTEGAISGLGEGYKEPLNERLTNAKYRGLLQGGLGGGMNIFTPIVAKAFEPLLQKYFNKAGRTGDAIGVDKDAAKLVKKITDMDEVTAKTISEDAVSPNLGAMGPNSAALLDQLANKVGPGVTAIKSVVNKNAQKSSEAFVRVLDDELGKDIAGPLRQKATIMENTKSLRNAHYKEAYDSKILWGQSDEAVDLAENLSRLSMKDLTVANRMAGLAGDQPLRIITKVNPKDLGVGGKFDPEDFIVTPGEKGTYNLFSKPTVAQIDTITRSMTDSAEEAVRKGSSGEANALKKLTMNMRNSLRKIVPAWDTAVKTGGNAIEQRIAVDIGDMLLDNKATKEMIMDAVTGMGSEQKKALRIAVRNTFDKKMSNIRINLKSENEALAAESAGALKLLSSRANREKMEIALGEKSTNAIFKSLDHLRPRLVQAGSILRGSPTYTRGVLDDVINTFDPQQGGIPTKVGDIVRGFIKSGDDESANLAKEAFAKKAAGLLVNPNMQSTFRRMNTVRDLANRDAVRKNALTGLLGTAFKSTVRPLTEKTRDELGMN